MHRSDSGHPQSVYDRGKIINLLAHAVRHGHIQLRLFRFQHQRRKPRAAAYVQHPAVYVRQTEHAVADVLDEIVLVSFYGGQIETGVVFGKQVIQFFVDFFIVHDF